jgi:DNA replication initiation complex subunit (GINS family)
LESLRRQLEAEARSEGVTPLARDFYTRVSEYSQQLRRSGGSGNSELTERLLSRQRELIRGMVRDLLETRTHKASKRNGFGQLLPEERYVCQAQRKFHRRFESFVEALSDGRPSYIEMAHRRESTSSLTVRFTKHVDELVGLNLRHYGPFEVDDLASIPAADAAVLIAAGSAVEVLVRDDI